MWKKMYPIYLNFGWRLSQMRPLQKKKKILKATMIQVLKELNFFYEAVDYKSYCVCEHTLI